MKIAFVSSEYKRSGVGTVTYNVSKNLRAMGHDARVFARTSKKPSESWFSAISPPSIFENNIAYPFYAAKRIAGEKADIWHGDVVEMAYACKLAGKKPLVCSLHDVVPLIPQYKSERNPLFRAAYRFWISQVVPVADALILDSKSALEDAVYAGLPREKLHAIYDGVECSKFFPSKKPHKREGKESEKTVLAYAGGFGPRKRIDRLADAMAILNKRHPEKFALKIAGNASERVKSVFHSRGVKNVHFEGFVADEKMREFYASSGIFVFTSDYEGFGLPVLEAMACGVPVVATNRSSLPEVVGSAGALCEPDAKSFADAIFKIASSEKLASQYAKAGAKRAGLFGWKKTAKAHLNLYEKILKK